MSTQQHLVNDWSSSTYSKNASFVYSSEFASPVLALLNPLKPGSKILDLGCGSGELTLQIASRLGATGGGGTVVGCDISSDMIRRAKELGLESIQQNQAESGGTSPKIKLEWFIQEGNLINEIENGKGMETYDSIFSSAALHWMKSDPSKVIKNVFDLLKVDGKFCGEFGGYLNMIGVRSALHSSLRSRGHDPIALDPWFFPTPTYYRGLLESAGFRVDSCELVPRITPLPTGLKGWLETFAFTFFEPFTIKEREEVIQEICDKLQVDLMNEKGDWEVMYVRLRFVAIKV